MLLGLNGCKDANEVLVKHSEFELIKIVDEAKPIPVSGLFSVNDFSEELLTLYDKGQPGGESTGWIKLRLLLYSSSGRTHNSHWYTVSW